MVKFIKMKNFYFLSFKFSKVLTDVKYENNMNLITDFFSRLYSPFMLIVFDSIIGELKDLQNLQIFSEINQSNVHRYFLNLYNYIIDFSEFSK